MNVRPTRLVVRIESDPAQIAEVRRQIEGFAAECGLDAAACDQVGLCLNEALANVIRHAYAGAPGRPIEITAEEDDGIRLFIRDWGCGVDPESIPQPPYDPLKPGGVGLICLRQCMDRVAFEPQPDGMLLTLQKRKSR